MPSVRTLTVSKGALKKLSNAAIDFDVRPHELVDAIVLNTNWETQVEKLVKIIRETRRGPPEPSPSPMSSPEKIQESTKKARQSSVRAPVEPPEVEKT